MSANSGFQVGGTGCQGREQVSLLPRSMWESNPLLMFRSLSCSLLSSVTVKSFFSFQKAKKKSADKQLVRESSVYFLLIQEETKIRSLRQHHAPSWTLSLPLSATTRVREPSGPVIPEPRTDLAGRFAATSCLQTLFPTPFFLLHCWTAFIFLSCKNLQSLF